MELQAIVNVDIDFYNNKYILINAKQCDKNSRYLSVTCYNQGEVYPINAGEHSAYIRYKKSDDYSVFNFCEIDSNGKILVELTEQMLASDGICHADLVIVNKGKANVDTETGEIVVIDNASILSTMVFHIDVSESPVNNYDIESSYEFNGLNTALEKAEASYTDVIRLAKSYAVGDAGGIRDTEDYDNAKYYASNASISATNSALSERNAKVSENNAKTSELNAKTSETNALTSEQKALASETKAKTSETNSKTSETNAKVSETNALTSETNALASEQKAKTSETNSTLSERNAKVSENNAKTSETNALASEQKALASETKAKTSEQNALVSEQKASASEQNSKTSEINSKTSEDNAKTSELKASASEQNAKTSATNSTLSERNAKTSENNAKTSETNAKTSEDLAKSYAVGNTGIRNNENTDNSLYYYEMVKSVANGLNSAFIPMGTISFSELATVEKATGFTYNIDTDFVTDSSFAEGSGKSYTAGVNVYCRSDGLWDCFGGAASPTASVAEVKEYLGI